MKTAISIPDYIFQRAEELAAAQGVSRSELYVLALREYMAEREAGCVTERLDEVYDYQPSNLEQSLADAQAIAVMREEW